MNREEFIQRCTAYALGALDEPETGEFEHYLAGASAEEQQLAAELMATASLLPAALPSQRPSPSVKNSLMRKVALTARAQDAAQRRASALQNTTSTRNWIPWGIAAALAMIALFSLFVVRLLGTIESQNRQLAATLAENQTLQTRLASLQDELARREEQLKVLAAKEIHISIMSGLDVNPVGYGKIIWDPEKGAAILQVSNLPAVPADKDYQLWVIKDKKPISAGVFAVEDPGDNFYKIEGLAITNPKEIAAFAVTLEPKGGVPQPTGAMYMLGSPRL